MALLSRRSFIAGLFVAPAIVKATSIMPVKAMTWIGEPKWMTYMLRGFGLHGEPQTETVVLPLVDGRFDPSIIERMRPMFSKVDSIVWSDPHETAPEIPYWVKYPLTGRIEQAQIVQWRDHEVTGYLEKPGLRVVDINSDQFIQLT